MATGAPVEVTLKSSDGQDSFPERRFTLGPTASMRIGRASKSPTKPDLLMAEYNAYIDSPVVSRDHAFLAVEHTPPTPHVFIVDQASMHGTYLNGNKLVPSEATKLRNGDVLQFGVDVSRNDTFYTARKYLFESTLPNHFPRAFSVPENDSSEDEEIDADDIDDIMTSPAPRYGTQTNPVNVDDFEDAPPALPSASVQLGLVEEHKEVSVANEQTEPDGTTEEPEVAVPACPAQASNSSPPQLEDVDVLSQGSEEPASSQVASPGNASSGEDEDQSDYFSEDSAGSPNESIADADEIDSDSNAGHSDSESEVADLESEADDDNNEDEADRSGLHRARMMTMLNAEQDNSIFHEPPFAPRPSAPIGVPHLIDSPVGPAARRDEPYSLFNAGTQTNASATLRGTEQPAPPMGPFIHHPLGMFEDPFGSHAFGQMSPVPPRPAAPRPVPWGTVPFVSPYAHPEPAHLRMFSEEMQSGPMFMPNAEFPSEMFERYAGVPASDSSHRDQPSQPNIVTEQPWTVRELPNVAEVPSSTAPVASEVQTPPPAVAPEPSSPPQPRRTKVSIPEIVDSPPQPPTPTSVKGSLKRKAEALEDDASEVASAALQLDTTTDDESVTQVAAVAMQAPRTSTPQRPIKKFRSRLQNAAKYTLGAAVAVALMSQIPDAFFEA